MFENYDREYLKRVLLRILGVVLGLLIIAYIGYQIWHKVTSNIKYEPATPYTYTVKTTGDGYIIRSESAIRSPGGGSVVPSVDTGAKVSAGSEVANLYSSSGVDVRQRLAEIDAKIALLSLSANDSLTNRDVSKLDSETYSIITDIRRCVEQGKISEATSYKMNLITKINRRNAASGTEGNVSSQIDTLRAEKAQITSSLGALISTVRTPLSGWYYPDTDGYESVFSPDKTENITYESFKELISATPSPTGGDAGKVVTSPTWYFVCELPAESLDTKEIGKEYSIFFPHNNSAKIVMSLEKISRQGDAGIAVFKSDKIPAGFDFARIQSYELIENEYTGFRIPKSAVRVLDGQMGVYVLTGETVNFRKIEVMTEYENTYIVVMDHEVKKEEETTAPVEDDEGMVAQSPEWSKNDTEKPAATEAESAPETSPAVYKWLGLNENVIVSGKGLSNGRIITNNN